MFDDGQTIGLIGAVLVLLCAATGVVQMLKHRPESGIDPAIIETFQLRVRAWWILFSVLAAAFFIGQTATVVLFGLISFWALREFITLTPTRPGDHRTLFFVFFIFTPLQYRLGGNRDYYGLYSIVIPVYGFLFIPAAIALAGDYKRFLERTAKIQCGLADLRLLPELRPGLADAETAAPLRRTAIAGSSGGNVRLLFFFVLIVQLSDALQYLWSQIPSKHVIVPAINPSAHLGRTAGRHGQRDVDRRRAVVGHALPRRQLVDGRRDVGGDLADGLRRRHHHVGHQTRPRREGLRHAGRRPRRRAGPHRLDLLRRPRLLPLHPLVADSQRLSCRRYRNSISR